MLVLDDDGGVFTVLWLKLAYKLTELMANDTCKLIVMNKWSNKISCITKLLLNFKNTDASTKTIIVTAMHWFQLSHLPVPNDSTCQLKVSAYNATTPLTSLFLCYISFIQHCNAISFRIHNIEFPVLFYSRCTTVSQEIVWESLFAF